MTQVLRQSTQIIVRVGPAVDVNDGFTPVTSLTLSGADEAELLKSNSSTTVDISAATFAAITDCDGWYALTLTTSHTDTVGALDIMVNDDSLILPIFTRFQVVEEAIFDAFFASSAALAVGSVTGNVGGNVTGSVGSIASGGISSSSFASGAIDAAAIAANAIGSSEIADGAITAAKIADGAIDAATFASGAITADAIAADAIGASELAADAAAEIADAVWDEDATGHQTGGTFGQAIGDPGADTNTIFKATVTDATNATVGLDVAAVLADTGTDGVVVASINNNAITAASIASNAIGSAEIADGAITAAKIATDAIDADALADGAITAATFAAGAIDASAIADDAIDAGAIAANAITAAKIASDAITAAKIATGAIDADALAADAANEIADALLDRSAGIETNRTLRQGLRLMLSALVGKASGLETTTAVFRDTNDTTDRITATVDEDGNRSAVTLDAS